MAPAFPTEKNVGLDEKEVSGDESVDGNQVALHGENRVGAITDAEYKNASRAMRTAGWSSIFYLVTTDILGPFSTP